MLVSLLFLAKQRDEDRYLLERVNLYRSEYTSIIAAFSRLAEISFSETFGRTEFVDLFAAASAAGEEERDRIRAELYQKLLPSYQRISSKNFRQVHYHFADGTSFLRLHLPEQHGDNLFPVRSSLRIANIEKRYVEGFELGRHFHAFRFLFPIQKGGVHLGTIEASVPFYAIRNSLRAVSGHEYLFIVKKEQLENILFDQSKTNYIEAIWARNYMYEKADLENISGEIDLFTISQINMEFASSINGRLEKHEGFSIPARLKGFDYLVDFLPVEDVEGDVVGYIISYSQDSTLASIRKGYMVSYLLATILLILLFITHIWSSRKIMLRLRFQQQLIDSMPTAICLKDPKGFYQSCNDVFANMLGVPKNQIIGSSCRKFMPPDIVELHDRMDKQLAQHGDFVQDEMSLVFPDNEEHDLVVHKAPFIDDRGHVTGIVDSTFDVSERKQAQREIENSHAELQQIFDTAANGMRVVDNNQNIIRANKTFYELTGLAERDVVGKKCFDVFPGMGCHTNDCPLRLMKSGKTNVQMEIVKKLPSGNNINCIVTAMPHYDSNGNMIGIIEDFQNITRYRELEQRLRDIAVTDELTGLFNRRGFLSFAEKQLHTADRAEYSIFLLFADLDNMKNINDSLGHDWGDTALKLAARILRETFRKSDIVARLGGDEFAVLVICKPGSDSEDRILNRLEKSVTEVNEKKSLPFLLSISFGVVQQQKKESLDDLMKQADQCMYENKIRKKEACESS